MYKCLISDGQITPTHSVCIIVAMLIIRGDQKQPTHKSAVCTYIHLLELYSQSSGKREGSAQAVHIDWLMY